MSKHVKHTCDEGRCKVCVSDAQEYEDILDAVARVMCLHCMTAEHTNAEHDAAANPSPPLAATAGYVHGSGPVSESEAALIQIADIAHRNLQHHKPGSQESYRIVHEAVVSAHSVGARAAHAPPVASEREGALEMALAGVIEYADLVGSKTDDVHRAVIADARRALAAGTVKS